MMGMEKKDYATAVMTALLTASATFAGSYMTFMGKLEELSSQEAQKAREVNIKVLDIALSVLSQEPEKLQSLRGWAVDVVNRAAPVPISQEAREQLMRTPLPAPKEQKKEP